MTSSVGTQISCPVVNTEIIRIRLKKFKSRFIVKCANFLNYFCVVTLLWQILAEKHTNEIWRQKSFLDSHYPVWEKNRSEVKSAGIFNLLPTRPVVDVNLLVILFTPPYNSHLFKELRFVNNAFYLHTDVVWIHRHATSRLILFEN